MAVYSKPGTSADVSWNPRQIQFGPTELLYTAGIISSAAIDSGNTPTTLLRGGLLLGKLTSGGELVAFNPDATDGSENVVGILTEELTTLPLHSATAEDKFYRIAVGGNVRTNMLLIEGAALDGATGEYKARRQLAAMGFRLSDDLENYKSGVNERAVTATGDVTVTADQNGTKFVSIAAADVDYTLPAATAGLKYQFAMAVNQEIVLTGSNNIVAFNDAAASTITATTTGEQVGVVLGIEGIYVAGTAKWFVTNLSTGAPTIAVA